MRGLVDLCDDAVRDMATIRMTQGIIRACQLKTGRPGRRYNLV